MFENRKHTVLSTSAAIVVLLSCSVWWIIASHVDIPAGIFSAKKLLARGSYEQAMGECDRILRVAPNLTDALVIKGECLQRLDRIDDAMAIYARVGSDGSEGSVAARLTEASVFLQRGQITLSLQKLEEAERVSPESPALVALKASALTACGRRWESMRYLRKSLDMGVGDTLANLIYLAVPDQMPQPNEKYLELVVRNKDAIGAIGAARVAMALGIEPRAAELLSQSRHSHPEIEEVYIQQATLFLNANQHNAFLDAIAAENVDLQGHPEYWLLLGRYSQEAGQSSAAIRCYWEVLKRHPDQDRACYQLGQLLTSNKQPEEGRRFIERAGRLSQLVEKASILYDRPTDRLAMVTCAEMTYELGRYRESRYWCELLLAEPPSQDMIERVRKVLELLKLRSDVWQDTSLNVAAHIDLTTYPLPDFDSMRQWRDHGGPVSKADERLTGNEMSKGGFLFSNDEEIAGLRFTYRNGSDPATEGRRMFEYTGGGVAALDFDCDGFDDIHLTQGSDWPPDDQQVVFLDQTFRNIRGREFQNVSNVAGLGDPRFSQGVSGGDIDNDGFPDLYVGNIAGNSLYHNNGDGTFTNITASAGVGHEYWTTSCAIADVNGDSLPDLYDVTFLQGADVFTKICEGEGGVPRSCAPAAFDAAPDFVWENLGDGTFRPFSAESGLNAPDGDGLGILISDFDQSGQLSIFVANDGRANFFYVPRIDNSSVVTWQEVGVVNGSAFDAAGKSQACMGVASADFDKNGLLDLFVTNFYQEANTLYVNMGANTFLDQSRRFGLHDPSYGFLGFGTQFLDADLDSWQDLVVTNGHVDDFRHKNIPYRMRPQLFQNETGQRFLEVAQETVGSFFASEHMGRGMAKLDWNRDFLADVVISQLDEAAVLLTNQTIPQGKGTGLRLIETSADRDAIGTRVVVEAGGSATTYFMTAGDGYQSSNTREIILATPADGLSFTLRVFWRSGVTQVFEGISPGKSYTSVAGRSSLYVCP